MTSLPNPEEVRPESILKKTLKLMSSKWKSGESYIYLLDQFKSMRQDLTIQKIKNEFTVKVYEVNARVSLYYKDLDQFNQCQSQLINLYKEKIKGNLVEFMAYRVIYNSLIETYEVEKVIHDLFTTNCYYEPEIINAMEIRKSLNEKNYF
jgi:hypothetical protein